jgi:ABC-2 type transport system ATP-binding protein
MTWDVVRQLRRDGTTVLLTTHYLEEAEALADRVAIMHMGRIATTGAPHEVVGELPARISFLAPDGTPPPTLPHATVVVDEGMVSYQSSDLQADLTQLLRWANHIGLDLSGLSARAASLEDVLIDIAETDATVREARL